MDYKLKNRDGVETTYTKDKIKIPAATGDNMVVFTQGEVQAEKTVTITENGTTEVTPDAGYGSVKKCGVTVDVPTSVTSVNGATGDVKTNWYCSATYSNNDDSVTMDKTVDEIRAAYSAGYNVLCGYTDDTLSSSGTIPLITVRGEKTCIFSGTGAEEALATPSAPITRTIYYDSSRSSWKCITSATHSSYLVTLREKNGVLTANKTYNDIQSELLRQFTAGGGISIQVLDANTSTFLQIASTSVTDKMLFQGTAILNGEKVLVSDEVDINNTWTSTIIPLTDFVVTVTQNEGNYAADKTFEQISTAYNSGQNIILNMWDVKGDLSQISDSSVDFTVNLLAVILVITIQNDNTVSIDQQPLFPLEVFLTKSGDTYSADETFANINATLDYGQTVHVNYSGTYLYLANQTDARLLFTGLIVSGDGVTAICATVQSDDTWTYNEVIVKEPTSGA